MFTLRTSLSAVVVILLQAVTATAQNGGSNHCARVVRQQRDAIKSIESERPGDVLYAFFDAKTAYECISQVPLDTSNALEMIEFVKDYSVFQTTLAYLKDPPDSYQQPAVDVMGRLDELAEKVEAEEYDGQYDFDVDLLSIFIDAHDTHFSASLGVMGLFAWILPDTLVSVSSDGEKLPEVFAKSDVLRDVEGASPIVEIEDESVFTYLQKYAARTAATGSLDPHGDWNLLMWSPAYQFNRWGALDEVSYWPGFFEMTTVYNGESLSGRFANGSSFEWKYQAGSVQELDNFTLESPWEIAQNLARNLKTAPLSNTPGRLKVRRDEDSLTPSDIAKGGEYDGRRNLTSVPLPHYPDDPIVIQSDLGQGGLASGYLLSDDSVGVLSLPSFFELLLEGESSIATMVEEFIEKCKDAGAKKIVIDVSGNTGGDVLLSYVTFKLFFPNTYPSLLFRGRASSEINTIGSIATKLYELDRDADFDEDIEDLLSYLPDAYEAVESAIGLASSNSVTEEGEAWPSWEDFYGPVEANGDTFTNLATYNFTYLLETWLRGRYVSLFDRSGGEREQPWDAEDIVLLDDGSCGSACSLFSEMVRIDAGVRVVAVGGIPKNGPMQAMMGTRGGNVASWLQLSSLVSPWDDAHDFSSSDLVDKFMEEAGVTKDDIEKLPPGIYEEDVSLDIRGGSVNLLDVVRPDSPKDPLQFAYQAADCRLFYTAEMMRDVTQLWLAAAEIAEGDFSACVPGSTNAPGVSGGKPVMKSPGFTGNDTWANVNTTDAPTYNEKPRDPSGKRSGDGDDDVDDEDSASLQGASVTMLMVLAALVIGITSN